LKQRISKVCKYLEEEGLEGLIVDAPVDLFYLTGHALSLGRLLIDRQKAHLLVDGRYFEAVQSTPGLSAESLPPELLSEAPPLERFFGAKRVGFDALATSYASYQKMENFKGGLTPLLAPIRHIRAIKEPEEIQLLREAADLGARGFDYICKELREGVSEKEIAQELEIFWKQSGAETVAFPPIIAFGANAAFPHHRVSTKRLKKGECVLCDIGVVWERYHSDMTRTLFFGSVPPKLATAYAIVKEAQARAIEKCLPGAEIIEIDHAARSWIDKQGYGKFFPHGLGHGVGLEIHELPRLRDKPQEIRKLEPGMVITIEPGIYLPDLGGIRIEDTLLITEKGHENLTNRPVQDLPILG
jgi:Xaa-Pro aminopeptidase